MAEEDVVDQQIGQYCDISKGPRKSVGEMEQEFLLALQVCILVLRILGCVPATCASPKFAKDLLCLRPYCECEYSHVGPMGASWQSFYMDCAPIMSNEEFDNLKEELLWEGSEVVILSKISDGFCIFHWSEACWTGIRTTETAQLAGVYRVMLAALLLWSSGYM